MLLLGVAYWVLVVAAASTALTAVTAGEPRLPRPRLSAVVLWLTVAVPSVAQVVVPGLLDDLMRDSSKIAAGQWWRLASSAVVQDGGVAGGLFNLVALAVIATAAVTYWGGVRTWVVFWAGAVASNLAVLASQPHGAGSSMATFVLACALSAHVLTDPARRALVWPMAVAGVLSCVVILALERDYHAVACLLGVVAGLSMGVLTPPGRRAGRVALRVGRAARR